MKRKCPKTDAFMVAMYEQYPRFGEGFNPEQFKYTLMLLEEFAKFARALEKDSIPERLFRDALRYRYIRKVQCEGSESIDDAACAREFDIAVDAAMRKRI